MRRYALRDDQWDRIKDFLPGREGHVGGTAADNRLFVEAVVYRYRAGIPWRDLPERFGDWKSSTSALIGGRRAAFSSAFSGFWRAITTTNTDDRRHHRAGASAQRRRTKKNGEQAIGRSRGGLTTKIHALVDALGNPVDLMLTPGQAHDLTCAEPLLAEADPEALIGDKAYDADPLLDTLAQRDIAPVIPQRPIAKRRGRATSLFTASAISSSASSTNSSTFAPSPPVTTNSPEISSPALSSPPLSSSSTEDRP